MASASEAVALGPAEETGPTPAIALTDVSVRYPFPSERVITLKEYAIRRLVRRIGYAELVALREVTLRILPGERIGVIGANGAGKSTLFRVIARVRRPSSGRVVVRGRVAPLLELGLGLHGELTGRENIVLQGALMGFSRRDMVERTPGIAAFAELERFLDAPMRTYSTGMSARLAFSAATHVDPDILLVDEALAVGDERFQAKCLDRMATFWKRGKTFLLVSHNMKDVVSSCERVLWIAGGRVVRDGPAAAVVEEYRDWAKSGAALPPAIA